jgi:peroxiredoxin
MPDTNLHPGKSAPDFDRLSARGDSAKLEVQRDKGVSQFFSARDDAPGSVRSHFAIDEHGNRTDVQLRVTPEDRVERVLHALGD